jgi:hypothetical protein
MFQEDDRSIGDRNSCAYPQFVPSRIDLI